MVHLGLGPEPFPAVAARGEQVDNLDQHPANADEVGGDERGKRAKVYKSKNKVVKFSLFLIKNMSWKYLCFR